MKSQFNYSVLILLLLFVSSAAIYYPHRSSNLPRFQSSSCLRSLGYPDSKFRLHSNAPQPPPYVKAELAILMTSNEKSFIPKNETIVHHLVKADGLCSGTFQIFNLGANFDKWEVRMRLYLDSGSNHFAEAFYTFSKDFNNAIRILIDKTGNFGVEVQFVNGGIELTKKPADVTKDDIKNSLKDISVENDRLCVLTPYNGVIVVRAKYSNGVVPDCVILKLKADFATWEKGLENMEWPTWGCGAVHANINYVRVTAALTKIIFDVECDTDFIEDNLKASPKIYRLILIEHYAVTLKNRENIPRNKKILFIVNAITIIDKCFDNIIYVQNSLSGVRLYLYQETMEEVCPGAKRRRNLISMEQLSCN